MFEVVFLGTSASAPSISRNLTATVVLHRSYRFLIDCGEGTQRQLLRSGLGFKRLRRILLTHGHLDHILGLGGLVSTFARWEATDRLEIYGGAWGLERVRDLIEGVVLRGASPSLKISFVQLTKGVILEDERFVLSAFPVQHRGPDSFGFTFQEKPRRPFLEDRAQALGVPAGPERRRLVRGETIALETGKQVGPEDVLGPPVPGTKLVYIGDVSRLDNLVEEVRGADALVVEGTYLRKEQALAKRYGHIIVEEAGRLAREAEVKDLYLNHISRRYSPQQILDEVTPIFPHAAVVKDLDRIEVRRSR